MPVSSTPASSVLTGVISVVPSPDSPGHTALPVATPAGATSTDSTNTFGWLPLLARMALVHATAATTTGVHTTLKWPNDLLARRAGARRRDRKVGGAVGVTDPEKAV